MLGGRKPLTQKKIESKLEQKNCFVPVLMKDFLHTFQMILRKLFSSWFLIFLESSETHFDLVASFVKPKK